jgi:glycine/D-amino acid oxidase-like deaminating enzyme
MGKLLAPKRVPVHWLAPPAPRDFELGVLPVTFWQLPATRAGSKSYHEFYALPVTRAGGWIKVAKHNHLANCDPLTMDREVRPDEVAEIQPFLENCIPSLAPAARRSEVCLYNLTLDGDFILGPLPGHTQVMTAALAGHGFKFAPVLGEIMADLLVGRPPAFDLAPFGAGRFS